MKPSGKETRLRGKLPVCLKQVPEDFHLQCLRQIADSPDYQRLVRACLPVNFAQAEEVRKRKLSEVDARASSKRSKHHHDKEPRISQTQIQVSHPIRRLIETFADVLFEDESKSRGLRPAELARKEQNLTAGLPEVVVPLKEHCFAFAANDRRCKMRDVQKELDEIFETAEHPDFDLIKDRLLELVSRKLAT